MARFTFLLTVLTLLTATQPASAQMVPPRNKDTGTAAQFQKLTCRKFDYYQLAGDRMVFEVTVSQNSSGNFDLAISNVFEVHQPDGSFKERSRALAKRPVNDMLCTQASVAVDAKIITCRKDHDASFDYLSVARMDRTQVLSAQASEPAKVIRYSSYDIEFLEAGGAENIFRQFDLKDCALEL
jgi:hypothetical protein